MSLPDGTKVWLNASITLIYPNAFAKNESVVELRGEDSCYKKRFLKFIHS
jgi:hypothetical protein